MSELPSSLVLAKVQITAEQLQMIQENQQAFLSIFHQQLREQAKTNELLALLIEALSDEQDDESDGSPSTYLDGTPISGNS